MKRIEYFGIDDPEKFMMSEQSDPSDCNKICMIHVHVLPFSNVVVFFHSWQIYFEMDKVTHC